jgi:hypothetical protein
MRKNILIGVLVAVLAAAAATGLYDLLRGDSALAYQGNGALTGVETAADAQGAFGRGNRGSVEGAWRGAGSARSPMAGNSVGTGGRSRGQSNQAALVVGNLTAAEEQVLLYMRQEEMLARDVYQAMGDLWGDVIFEHVASSEQTHMDAILGLLNKYGLEDPTAGREAGQFADSELQALYDQFLAQGSQSLEAALRVGALIEEIAILDLQAGLTDTLRADVQRVLGNLMRGSENHLRAFVQELGGDYQPSHLEQGQFEAILAGQNTGRSGNCLNGHE